MKAIALTTGTLAYQDCATPVPGHGEILIKVAYSGINRADLLQLQGRYPLPEGDVKIPGMEISGVVEACGPDVSMYKVGDSVCALLAQGGYAEYAVAHESVVLSVPKGMSLEQAACLPEACFTVWISLCWQGHIRAGETLLVHGGTSGIGNVAIQMARLLGVRVLATVGSSDKQALCETLGAERAINYKTDDFVAAVKDATEGKGADVILDMVGGSYFERNLAALAHGGRLCIIAFLQGSKVTANLSAVLLKHISIMGSTLRSRPQAQKAQIAQELRAKVWQALDNGAIVPLLDQVFPLKDAQNALSRMDQGLNVGKILLRI